MVWHFAKCHRRARPGGCRRYDAWVSYAILIREDEAGVCPVLVRQYDRLLTSRGVRWRFIAQTDDHDEALRTMELLQRRCESCAPSPAASATAWGRSED